MRSDRILPRCYLIRAKATHEANAKSKAKKAQTLNAKKALEDMQRWEKMSKKRKRTTAST